MSKKYKPVQKICGSCFYSEEDLSSINGLAYILCSQKKDYLSSKRDACSDFKFSERAKEEQERFERQQFRLTEDKRILAKSW